MIDIRSREPDKTWSVREGWFSRRWHDSKHAITLTTSPNGRHLFFQSPHGRDQYTRVRRGRLLKAVRQIQEGKRKAVIGIMPF